MMSMEYTFARPNDEVYFAYSIPYTFSKLYNFLKEVVQSHEQHV